MTSLASSTTRALARLSISGGSATSRRAAAGAVRVAQSQTHPFSTTPSATARASASSTRSKRGMSSPSRRNSSPIQTALEDTPDTVALTEHQHEVKMTKKHVLHLQSIGWLSEEQVTEALGSSQLPQWVADEWTSFCRYRSARARLWEPRLEPASQSADPNAPAVDASPTDAYTQEWFSQAIADHQADFPEYGDINSRIDELLIPLWQAMNEEQREAALVDARFMCLYKLGWRQGYTAGYPSTKDFETRKEIVAKTAEVGSAGHNAMAQLQESDRQLAWTAWLDMSAEERKREEAAAWAARDRTLLYIDDTPGKKLLNSNVPRWYEKPQRAGHLVFLPNFTMRLVRNFTPPGEAYDAYKATFRVPLNLHKHSVRSFLLQVYGLRTTWIRSMVYRSPLKMNAKRQLVSDNSRTHKKIEVGLLEPFVFPAITERQKEQHLMVREYEQMTQQALYKMRRRGHIRWRGGAPLAPREPISMLEPWKVDLLEPDVQSAQLEAEQQEELVSEDAKTRDAAKKAREPFVFNKVPQKWTQSHGKILKLLNERRNAKMNIVDEKAREMRDQRGA